MSDLVPVKIPFGGEGYKGITWRPFNPDLLLNHYGLVITYYTPKEKIDDLVNEFRAWFTERYFTVIRGNLKHEHCNLQFYQQHSENCRMAITKFANQFGEHLEKCEISVGRQDSPKTYLLHSGINGTLYCRVPLEELNQRCIYYVTRKNVTDVLDIYFVPNDEPREGVPEILKGIPGAKFA